ncbi:MAG: phosphoadenosine phosphosulfate reductase family protein [Gammaproteobacteria bacterium]
MHIIFGNYGNNSIALIQWAYENKLTEVSVVHVETGWAAQEWAEQVQRGQTLARRYGFTPITLAAPATFQQLVLDRGRFPSHKFQWCAGFLKGLPLIEWLDEVDASATATILLGSRRADSRARMQLPEFIESSEHFGERRIWHPLFKQDDLTRNALIQRAGIEVLAHRSLECDPCIHSQIGDLQRLSLGTCQRVANLEKQVQQPLFAPETFGNAQNIEQAVVWAKQQPRMTDTHSLEKFDLGCGAFFACGE